jgi:DNA-3-methyladenine glycosylase II
MPSLCYFSYGEKEIDWLKSRDKILGVAMDKIGHIERPITPDLFVALMNAIVGQQISSKAQASIWARIRERFSPLTPETISAALPEALQSCGISMRKALYIRAIAGAILEGRLDLNHLKTLSDEEVCASLCQMKGIGIWTAEMLMIFSLQRSNILSRDDLAIQRGLRLLYRHRKITPLLFARYKKRYAPYATVASLYLWAIAGGACPDLVEHAPKTKMRVKTETEQYSQ